MSGPYAEAQVRLYRDTLSTQWGFRLQGGADFKAPLTVQRVFVGSPADGTLSRGDIITSIENYDASRMIHKQAMDIVKQAGGSLSLSIRRSAAARAQPSHSTAPQPAAPQPYRSRPPEASAPKTPVSPGKAPPQFGMDYSSHAQPSRYTQQYNQASHHGLGHTPRGPPPTMLDRLQQSLNTSLWNAEDGDPDYEYKGVGNLKQKFVTPSRDHVDHERLPVKDLKRQYNALDKKAQTLPRVKPKPKPAQPHHAPPSVGPGPVWQKPDPSTTFSRPPPGLVEPGWTPKQAQTGSGAWKPVAYPGSRAAPGPTHHVQAPVNRAPPVQQPVYRPAPQPVNRPPPMQQPRPVPGIHHIQPESPAWAGSLKSSGGPKPWEMREAEMISGGGTAGIPPAPHAPVNVHQPRIQNVNYGPGATAPTYSQHSPGSYGQSDTAQVKHLQYNSPIGLYSRDNVQGALAGQTSGRPGEGTLSVSGGPGKSFDPDRSDVLRLLQEEEVIKQRGHGLRPSGAHAPQSARYHDQPDGEMNYHGFMDHSKKSPAMARLEYNLESGTVGGDYPNEGAVGEGTSDF